MGPIGSWYSIAIPAVIVGSLMIWRFKTGAWKLQEV
jgi:Na+-driven multidrug efflux pump